MAAELGWDQQRQAREIEAARAAYQLPWSIVKEKAGVL
jgi:hypothetical protein